MEFEYNKDKSRTNVLKHGITLEEATELWHVPSVQIEARFADEERRMIIGKLNDKCYSCIFTIRDGKIRLISARRSRMNEEGIYNEQIKKND